MNASQVKRITLTPEAVDCFVFWTKDPLNLLPHLDEIDRLGYRYYFQFTLTPYGDDLEPNLREKEAILRTLCELSERIGRERIVWRYDPIILNDALDIHDHEEQFSRLCDSLRDKVAYVNISFVDLYAKVKMPLVRAIAEEERFALAESLASIAKQNGLVIKACCEGEDLSAFGIGQASCIDRETIESMLGKPIKVTKDRNQRPGCHCLASVDIGAYDTCANGCVYCYANRSAKTVARYRAKHDPLGETLV
jgi:DNA repair photolyase